MLNDAVAMHAGRHLLVEQVVGSCIPNSLDIHNNAKRIHVCPCSVLQGSLPRSYPHAAQTSRIAVHDMFCVRLQHGGACCL